MQMSSVKQKSMVNLSPTGQADLEYARKPDDEALELLDELEATAARVSGAAIIVFMISFVEDAVTV